MVAIDIKNVAEFEERMRDPEFVRKMRRRANLGSLVGTGIEWYEYFVYGTTAAIVFPALFFPGDNYFVSVMSSFATFAVAFLVRPIGGAIFGHLGDRIGRRRTMVITLLITGFATLAVGILPTYGPVSGSGYPAVGVLAPILLLTLRVIQGIGVGGEWGGSVSMALEWGEKTKSGLAGAWPQMGSPLGLICATGMVSLITATTSAEQFLAWGWRIPFLFAGVLMVIGLVVRLRMVETPAFMRVKEVSKSSPVTTVLTRYPRPLILSAFLRLSEQAPFYIFTVYVLHFVTDPAYVDNHPSPISKSAVLLATMVAAAIDLVLVPFFARLGDEVGRRKMYYVGCGALILMAFPYFWALNSGNHALIFAAVSLSLLPHAIQYGSQSSLIAQQFPPEVRATGSSIGYQLASIVAGGPAPMIAAWLMQQFATGYAVSTYLVLCGIIAGLALRAMPKKNRLLD